MLASQFVNIPSFQTGSQQSPSSSKNEERGGSFFSFESMDASENAPGLTLLSLFDQSSLAVEESAFSFNFGGKSTAESEVDSGFPFNFGGGCNSSKNSQAGSLFSFF